MKTPLIALIGAIALLAAFPLQADQTNPPAPPPPMLPPHHDGPREFHQLMPPPMMEKLDLTDDQKQKIKVIEETFAKTQQEYNTAHKEEIDAAHKAMDKAMAGLQEEKKAAQEQIKSLLTPEQLQQVQNPGGHHRELHDQK